MYSIQPTSQVHKSEIKNNNNVMIQSQAYLSLMLVDMFEVNAELILLFVFVFQITF